MLAELLWDVVIAVFGPTFGPEDHRRDGPPGTSHWLRRHHRWNLAMRRRDDASNTRVPGLSRRWRGVVLEVAPGRAHLGYRLRWRVRWHAIAPTSFRRSDVRLPEGREVSKFRQIFPIQVGDSVCEVAVWTRDVRPLKEALDAVLAAGGR